MLEPGVLYIIEDPKGLVSDEFGVSPDGVGMIWYDTLSEVYDNHGEDLLEMYFENDEEFDAFRYGDDVDTDGIYW